MELETYLQRDALIALDLASSTTETAAGDGCSATEYACKAAGASKPCSGPPVRQPLAERRRTATQAATSTPDAIPCRARRRGAAPVPPVAPAAAAMSTSHRSSAWENRHQVIATDLAALAKLGTSRSSAGSALRDRRRATVPGCHGPAASAAAAGRGLQRRTASVEDVITQVLLSVDRDDVTATLDRLEDRPDQARSISENQQPRSRPQDAALLSSRPELSARLAAARIQGLSKQLAECRATKQQHSREASAAAHEAAQLRKERGALQQQAASLQAQVQLSKQTKLAAESQQALANREAALLDAANLQRVTKADTLRSAAEAGAKASKAHVKHAVAEAGHWRAAAEAARTAAQEQVSKHDMELIRLHEGYELLQQQNAELRAAFRKQQQLIGVLKRQKIHLASAKTLAASEKEFEEILHQEVSGRG